MVVYAAAIGTGFGSVELAMPAFAEAHGSRELGGLALACFSAGSFAGGFAAGLRPPRSVLRRFVVGSMTLSAALLGLLLAVSIPTLCAFAFVAGLPIAPTIGALYALIDRSARAGTAAEAFAWFGTAISIGVATGAALAGALVDEWGVRAAFAVGARTRIRRCSRGPRAARDAETTVAGDRRASVYAGHRAPVAQGTERRTSNPRVAGSNPAGRMEVPAKVNTSRAVFGWREGG